tara:strand:- start:1175 stop:1588 length:414 start_codon:yes stop_codon:yes gene_type:complete
MLYQLIINNVIDVTNPKTLKRRVLVEYFNQSFKIYFVIYCINNIIIDEELFDLTFILNLIITTLKTFIYNFINLCENDEIEIMINKIGQEKIDMIENLINDKNFHRYNFIQELFSKYQTDGNEVHTFINNYIESVEE